MDIMKNTTLRILVPIAILHVWAVVEMLLMITSEWINPGSDQSSEVTFLEIRFHRGVQIAVSSCSLLALFLIFQSDQHESK